MPSAALVSSLFTAGYANCHCWMKRACNYAFKLMSPKGVVCLIELIFEGVSFQRKPSTPDGTFCNPFGFNSRIHLVKSPQKAFRKNGNLGG